MAESETVQDLLVKAEGAAAAGDLAAADDLLHAIARIQESELGPQHPDLANTLNNLAIVAEKTGRPGDAEQYYRRAVAIASASLPADDPMVTASRQNLEDFCRAQGLPIDRPAEARVPDDAPPAPTPTVSAPPPAPAAAPPVAAQPKIAASQPKPEASPTRSSASLAKVAIAIVALVVAALFMLRPRSTRETPPSPSAEPAGRPSAQTAPPPAEEPARPLPAAPVAAATSPSPPAARAEDDRPAAAKPAAPAAAAPGAVTLAEAQLCRTLSTSGAWKCVPASDSIAAGAVVLYTRVRSPRDTVVVHRWYRGNTLRRSVQLQIHANATEGYRTFSRQTVDRGEWRVEVRSAAGDLLQEQHLAVR